ncbi:hypothetical protein [Streptomyces formicae]|uniref:hypothetical protein n=1 Tax=Streptomyces formicae TaxID=1616117 RepID=UPI00131CAE10|nr:hypothetical protein [Streptomyces formicae]
MAHPVATGAAVLLVGFSWAMESFLGKVTINRGYSTFDFPLVLNLGSVAVCLMACAKLTATGPGWKLTGRQESRH